MSKTYDTVASRDEEAVRRLVADNLNLVRKEAHREVGKTFGVSTTRADKVIGRALLRFRAAA